MANVSANAYAFGSGAAPRRLEGHASYAASAAASSSAAVTLLAALHSHRVSMG